MKKLDPRELFEVEADLPDLQGAVLVQALDGFIDAGAAKRLVREHLLLTHGSRRIVTFDVDQLLDYRARRPAMVFAKDHWESYDDPELAIHLLHDAAGTPFLVLAGPEPDAQWERFVTAVQILVDELGIGLTVGLNAIPMAVPHTRPIGVIGHGSRPELAGRSEGWVDTVQVPGDRRPPARVPADPGRSRRRRVRRRGAALPGRDRVPGGGDRAAGQRAVGQRAAAAAGRACRRRPAVVRTRIDEQVEQSTEVSAVVRALEEQYDRFLAGRERNLLVGDASELPTADELGAELEQFLAQQTPPGEGPAL